MTEDEAIRRYIAMPRKLVDRDGDLEIRWAKELGVVFDKPKSAGDLALNVLTGWIGPSAAETAVKKLSQAGISFTKGTNHD